jgi:hypothetical protein
LKAIKREYVNACIAPYHSSPASLIDAASAPIGEQPTPLIVIPVPRT